MISRLSSALLLLALGGCGLKGPLYLPDENGQEVSPQSSEHQKKPRTTTPNPAPPPAVPTDTTPAPPPPRH